MGRHSGPKSSQKYRSYYICVNFNNRGTTVCSNNVPVPMELAETAVLSTIEEFVLRPEVVEGAIPRRCGTASPL